jgi:hypothetical protein
LRRRYLFTPTSSSTRGTAMWPRGGTATSEGLSSWTSELSPNSVPGPTPNLRKELGEKAYRGVFDEVPERARTKVPLWMRVNGIGEIKVADRGRPGLPGRGLRDRRGGGRDAVGLGDARAAHCHFLHRGSLAPPRHPAPRRTAGRFRGAPARIRGRRAAIRALSALPRTALRIVTARGPVRRRTRPPAQ